MKKIIVGLLVITFSLCLLQIETDNVNAQETQGKTLYVDDDGSKNYTSIAEAITDSLDGDTIYVYPGIYEGYFLINKSISLIGEDKETTIIDGAIGSPAQSQLIGLMSDNVTITGFTIINSTIPPYIAQDGNVSPIEEINWMLNNGFGIQILSENNIIADNIIQNNAGYGILLNNSQNTIISNNTISGHTQSCIYLKISSNNRIINNSIENNERGIIFHINSTNNTLYHNNFINNTYYHAHSESNNIFYNVESQQGNFWDSYNGSDKNNDARGDTAYSISGGVSIDPYPLVAEYQGRLVLENFYVDADVLIFILRVGIVLAIIFCIPIAYVWYKKIR